MTSWGQCGFLSWSSSLPTGETWVLFTACYWVCYQGPWQTSLQTPFGLAMPFSKRGCLALGVTPMCDQPEPHPSAVPQDSAAGPALSPSLGTASDICLLNLFWRSLSAGWWMGVSLSLGCFMQPRGLVTSEGFFLPTGGEEWSFRHFF